jgi:pyrimidine-nucleoside phosphorylase
VIDDPDRLPSATRRTEVIASQSGVIGGIDAFGIGTAATALGAGRAVAEDVIDPAVGIELVRKCGERVEKGDVLAIAHHNSDLGRVHENIHNCFDITDSYREPGGLVIDRICS